MASKFTIHPLWQRHLDQWKMIEDLGVDWHSYGKLTLDKSVKNTPKFSAYWINGVSKIGYPVQKNEIRFISLILYNKQFKLNQRP